jgi:hypothetical protein
MFRKHVLPFFKYTGGDDPDYVPDILGGELHRGLEAKPKVSPPPRVPHRTERYAELDRMIKGKYVGSLPLLMFQAVTAVTASHSIPVLKNKEMFLREIKRTELLGTIPDRPHIHLWDKVELPHDEEPDPIKDFDVFHSSLYGNTRMESRCGAGPVVRDLRTESMVQPQDENSGGNASRESLVVHPHRLGSGDVSAFHTQTLVG